MLACGAFPSLPALCGDQNDAMIIGGRAPDFAAVFRREISTVGSSAI